MSVSHPAQPGRRARSLLGVLRFLRRYPGQVTLSLSILLLIIGIEMSLPRVLGQAINTLRWHFEWGTEFSPGMWVQLYFSLVLTRVGLAIILGPIRNRLIQLTLTDI